MFDYIDPFVCFCFGGGGSSAPPPTPAPPPPPPSKADENAAGRQAAVDQIRASNTSGLPSTYGALGATGDTSAAPKSTKTLLGA